ncbi:hypothetical protein Aperf_G00000104626 [Anoplocephala perfoliata]
MSYTDKRESFWDCADSTSWDNWNIILIILDLVGMIPGFLAMILLFRLDGKTRTSLLLLRTMLICTFLLLLSLLIYDIYPYPVNTASAEFNLFMCGLWSSRFLHTVLAVTNIHAFLYFAFNRTMQVVENLQFSFSSSRNADLVYIAGLFLYSAFICIPKIFTKDYVKSGCPCDRNLENQTFLDFAYARVYIFFVQVLIVNATILAICSGLIIRWVKNTPKDKFYDTLNVLSFPNTSEAELKAYEAGKRWSTPSMCIVPLSGTFILSITYDNIYQFLSAVGLTKYQYSTPLQKISHMLVIIHPVVIPYILFYYIPALRFWVVRQWRRLRGQSRGLQIHHLY